MVILSYVVGKLCMAAVYAILIVAVFAAISVSTGAADSPITAWLR